MSTDEETTYIVTQTHVTEAESAVAAAQAASESSSSIYQVEDDLGRLYEIDLDDNDPQAIPLPPF